MSKATDGPSISINFFEGYVNKIIDKERQNVKTPNTCRSSLKEKREVEK